LEFCEGLFEKILEDLFSRRARKNFLVSIMVDSDSTTTTTTTTSQVRIRNL
jgi:hypothetical protein